MPDEQTTPETPETPAPKDGEPGSEETPKTTGEEAPKDGETPPEEKPQMSLEDALAEVEKTRGEAANYRVRARNAEEALKSAKSLDEVNEIVANMSVEREKAERALLVENVALKHNLPDALAARLQGATREELEADAKALASLIPAPQEEPTPRLRGGLDPTDPGDTDSSDPGALARKYAPRR